MQNLAKQSACSELDEAAMADCGEGVKWMVGKNGRKFKDNDELLCAVNAYFTGTAGIQLNEFSLANALGVTNDTLRQWKKDENDADRQFIIQSAYDRITDAVISSPDWNDKFMQQKARQILESGIFAGYNTKVDVKGDHTVTLKFGENMDAACMD